MAKDGVPVFYGSEVRRSGVVYDNPGLTFDPSECLTKQSFKDECDINNIIARADRDGFVEHIRRDAPSWGVDVSSVVDYQTALNMVQEAQDSFMALPAKVRARFHNDPGAFLSFMEDPSNREEAVLLGLLEPSKPVGDKPTLNDTPEEAALPKERRRPSSVNQPKAASADVDAS